MILKTAANMQEHGYIETGKEGGYYEVDGQRTEIGGGGSSDLVPLEFVYFPKTRGYNSVKTLGEIIADADSINQCITFTSEYFSEGIPTGYPEGTTYRLIYADNLNNMADVQFVPTDRVDTVGAVSITVEGVNIDNPLSIVGK